MPYVTRNNLLTYFAEPALVKFLDDDRDGMEDPGLLNTIILGASEDVDGRLSQTYSVPFSDPAPQKVQAAALILVCEALYHRRQIPDEKNPFKMRADYWREQLDAIGRDGHGLDASTSRDFQAIGAITAPSFIDDNSL